MKFILKLILILLLISITLSFQLQSKLKVKSDDIDDLIEDDQNLKSGNSIDRKYNLKKLTSEKSSIYLTQRWIAVTSDKSQAPVILKFYQYLLEARDPPEILIRRKQAQQYQESLIQECKQMKIIQKRITQDNTAVRFDQCITKTVQPPSKNSVSNKAELQKQIQDYNTVPIYNVFTMPVGESLNDYCILDNCQSQLRQITGNIVKGLVLLNNGERQFKHGNLNIYDIYWNPLADQVTLSNMQYNINPIAKKEGKNAYETDLKDLAGVLAKILSKNPKFEINKTQSPFQLFKQLHRDLFANANIDIDSLKNDEPEASEQNDASNEGIEANNDQNEKQQGLNYTNETVTNSNGEVHTRTVLINFLQRGQKIINSNHQALDTNKYNFVSLGAKYAFDPFDVKKSEKEQNQLLRESIYEFILKLRGQSQNNKKFYSLEEVQVHPFMAQKMEQKGRPTDVI